MTNFRNPPEAPTQSVIAANVATLGYPAGWSAQDDLALITMLFEGRGLSHIAAYRRQPYAAVEARWKALKAAAGSPEGMLPLDAQTRLLAVLTARAERGGLV